MRERKSVAEWDGQRIQPGESKDIELKLSESYSGVSVSIPIHVRRGEREGPTVFVTAALHGDEINGTGAIRQLIQDEEFVLSAGSVILVPVLNLLAFDRHSRYMPDRRDLNRAFPGSKSGSLTARIADTIFDALVSRSDFGIDLHTAAVRRTNYPNVRGDLSDAAVRRIAFAFGSEVVVDGHGPDGAFRREACAAGCPTIIMEGGEVWKVEPGIVESAVRGVKNVLQELGMMDGLPVRPAYQIEVTEAKWIRAERGGFLQFHVSPGDIVEEGQDLATNATLLGRERSWLKAPYNAVVIGMTTLPAVSPGEAVFYLGRIPEHYDPADLRARREATNGLEERLSDDLASNVLVVEPTEHDEE